jgi:hypothetical protein
MQKKLFQTLLTAAIISTPVGQAYAQQGVYCAQGTTTEEMNSDCMAWAEGQIQPCGNSQCAEITGNSNCSSGYSCECVYSACPNPPSSPDKKDMKDKRVERHKEAANETSDANGNAAE